MVFRLDRLTENSINPVTMKPYDNSWTVFVLTDSREYNLFVGSNHGCAYTVKFSRYAHLDWRLALCDMMAYNECHDKNTILVLKESELGEARRAYSGHSFRDAFLRPGEPDVLVHSTTWENYQSILKDGMLKSFSRLGIQEEPIGAQLGDPADFRDYIMLGSGVTCEIIVSSKQAGRLVMDADAAYRPGARMYFDAQKIAKDGLLVRDGCHLKVHSQLPLKPYLIFTATTDSIHLEKTISTPGEFTTKADAYFSNLIHG